MRISQQVISDVLRSTDIVDLIHSRVSIKKAGGAYVGCCPFHPEKSPSFHVNREKGFYHCFGCQAGGNAIGFLMSYDSIGFRESVEYLANLSGITLDQQASGGGKDQQPIYTYNRPKKKELQ